MSKYRFLVIQTAFIGDAILATATLEELQANYPNASIDLLVRKGNESLFENHPHIRNLYIWDKRKNKIINLINTIRSIRKERYTRVINLHRFLSSGLITALSRAKSKASFRKNPLSIACQIRAKHLIGQDNSHEVERNAQLIQDITTKKVRQPKLYLNNQHEDKVKHLKNGQYICVAPTSVWFTKQLPREKWTGLLDKLPPNYKIYLLGAPNDREPCEQIIKETKNKNIQNLAGTLSLLESAALMKDASMNYVNDSAPLHLASAVNAPVTAAFCSTTPELGFGPLSDTKHVIETKEKLECRPCGIHGYDKCPKAHFRCAHQITIDQLISTLYK